MKILVIGARGMLGQDLVNIFSHQNFEIIQATRDTFDITNESSVKDFFKANKFDLVIHAAAYTNVDEAETNQETAFLVNGKSTENLAKYSSLAEIPIIYISTDYVFDGTKNSPYNPDDKTNPINIYGLSKLKGEEAVKKYNNRHYIIRTSWLYGHKGKNFIETIINLAQKNPELKVISDQIGCPTWTIDLANSILELIKNNKPYGIYHICGSGSTSWHGFAVKILEFAGIDSKVLPVATEEFPRPAKRPKYSVMDNANICPDWEISLNNYIKLRENK